MADSSLVTTRLTANGGVNRPLTYDEVDANFVQLKSIIDDYNAYILSQAGKAQSVLMMMNKQILSEQANFQAGVQNVFTASGNQLTVPISTVLYNSGYIDVSNRGASVNIVGLSTGGIRVQVTGYDATGTQITGQVDADFTINGVNQSFVASPTYEPSTVDNSSSIDVIFTTVGQQKAALYTISIEQTQTNPLLFTLITFKG